MNVILVVVDSLQRSRRRLWWQRLDQNHTLDALSKETLRFTQAYAESVLHLSPARDQIVLFTAPVLQPG